MSADADAVARYPPQERSPEVRARILRGARLELAASGLSVRVEDVAVAAGVSRRTVFRYFDTREQLIAAAVRDSMRSYGDHVPRPKGEDLGRWLTRALVAIHRMNAQHGRIYFELVRSGASSGEIGEIVAARRAARELVAKFATTAWQVAGGQGRPPTWLHDTVAVLISAHATEALGPDFGRTPAQIGRRLAQALVRSIETAVIENESG